VPGSNKRIATVDRHVGIVGPLLPAFCVIGGVILLAVLIRVLLLGLRRTDTRCSSLYLTRSQRSFLVAETVPRFHSRFKSRGPHGPVHPGIYPLFQCPAFRSCIHHRRCGRGGRTELVDGGA
jgi:hypothetical protein